ncbi:preprotein translocase subunit SecD [Gimesia alba]|uniref:Preprotein translocase subunit SecD n=1 Tax=Gimesia alba TaxID=2527973 RepID=A0A517RP00_9PLAN|nr:hypothetical protein [Gimesia alba]QDT45584.1 preprotein translocase subunit SecD [Gimesia alba]
MTDPETPTETIPATPVPEHLLAPLTRSLPVIYFIYLFLILGFVLSTILFLVQFRMEVEPGILLTDSRSGRLAVFVHLARACVFLLLALALHKYTSSLRHIRRNTADALDRYLKASLFLWNTLCISVLLVIGFGIWSYDVSRDPSADFAVGQEIYAGNPQPDAIVEFFLAEMKPGEGLEKRSIEEIDRDVWLPAEPILSNQHFMEAQVGMDPEQMPLVTLKLNEEGAAIIRKASREHVDKPLAVVVDGEVIMAPIIRAPMGAEVMITGIKTMDEAKRIARSLSGNK